MIPMCESRKQKSLKFLKWIALKVSIVCFAMYVVAQEKAITFVSINKA